MPFYLGLDASTQSVTAVLIEIEAGGGHGAIAATHTLTYDEALPEYRTTRGVISGDAAGVVVAPPAMWADALDRVLGIVARAHRREAAALAGIGVAAQQHASVCLGEGYVERFRSLDPRAALGPQIADALTRPVAPVWLDSSTTTDCAAIAAAVGGDEVLAARTGSRAFERFTGPQIRKWAREEPTAYAATTRIHLLSSFLTSMLAGADAAVEPGDASGMNLMDLSTAEWWQPALDATAPDLLRRLPTIVPSSSIIGDLAPYWRARYGFASAPVVVGTGDNPSSLIGTGVVDEGQLAISLGTSDTVFGPMGAIRVSGSGEGHVFGAPTGAFMGLTCFANGSLARERVRDGFGLSWTQFSQALCDTPPGNGDRLMLPWFDPEITPHVPEPRVRRDRLDERDVAGNIRAVIEAQMMAMANHSAWMGAAGSTTREITATGGASVNREVLQIMADVFGADVRRLDVPHSAALGAALRARHASMIAAGTPEDWHAIVSPFTRPTSATRIVPRAVASERYDVVRGRYAIFEELSRAENSSAANRRPPSSHR